jgi:hypothetical protein
MRRTSALLALVLLLAMPAAAQQTITIQPAQLSAVANGTLTRNTSVLANCTVLDVLVKFTTTGTATGSVQLFLEDSADGGTTWDDLISSNLFVLGAAASSQHYFLNGMVGTTATSGAAPAIETLAAGTTRQGPFGDRIRVREVITLASGSPVGTTYLVTAVCKP